MHKLSISNIATLSSGHWLAEARRTRSMSWAINVRKVVLCTIHARWLLGQWPAALLDHFAARSLQPTRLLWMIWRCTRSSHPLTLLIPHSAASRCRASPVGTFLSKSKGGCCGRSIVPTGIAWNGCVRGSNDR